MKDVFESHTVAYLKKEISNFKNIIKGYSKLKKTEIVELMLSYSNFFSYISSSSRYTSYISFKKIIGVNRLRTKYGSKKNRGMKPERFRKA